MPSLAIDTRQHTIFRTLNTIFRTLNTIFRTRRGPAIPFSLHGIEAGRRSRGIDILASELDSR